MTQPAVTIFNQQIMWMMQPDVIIFNQRHDWGKLAVTLFNQQIWEMQMMMMMMSWCLMSTDVIWHIRDKLWPMPKHSSIKAIYVRCMRV